ncbi:hypothetical protein [Neobacillus jeddahensis]|uniref:hypothetical protein n=1 Tax=Neobacillus jeddahensis TaxID=1461580 RepID=UPI00058F9B6D|nr:hypothetical protein [Neobacillus jeddahensis]
MDKHLQQTFDFRFVKIGAMVNGGVLQIGTGSGHKQRTQPSAYTTVGTTLIHLGAPIEFAVPLQAPVRPKL